MWIRSSCFDSGKLTPLSTGADFHNLKVELEQLLLASLTRLTGSVLPEMPAAAAVVVERSRDAQHGDFATNVALRLAKAARKNPRELAATIVAALPANPLVARTEVAGAGFINFYLTPAAYARELECIHAQGAAYGESRLGGGERVLVEFVSANPTGPLHVGHGRQAAYGATLANLLARWVSAWRASTTSTTPGGRWTSSPSAPGCATWNVRGSAAVSRERLPRRVRTPARAAVATGSRG